MLTFKMEFNGFIDCHNHLADPMFTDDIHNVVDNAREAGVVAALVCAETPSDIPKVLLFYAYVKRFPTYCCLVWAFIQYRKTQMTLRDASLYMILRWQFQR